jgi:hypothetical protein
MTRSSRPVRAAAGALIALAVAACRPASAGGGAGSCSQVADAVREQFHLGAVTITCPESQERTALVEIVDVPLMRSLGGADAEQREQAAAELVARSIWARAGIRLKLTAIMVTLSAESSPQAAGAMYSFGRGLVSFWTAEAADTTRRCLTGDCGAS